MVNVLIVEDEIILRKGICTLIDWKNIGVNVVGDCSNGIEALQIIEDNQIDLVISDIKMPGMDGLELAEKIKQKHSHIKVILLTACPDFTYAQTAIRSSVYDYVLKSNFIKTLPISVQNACEKIAKEKTIVPDASQIENQQIIPYIFAGIINGVMTDEIETSKMCASLNLSMKNYYLIKTQINWNSTENEDAKKRNEKAMENFINYAFGHVTHFSFWLNQDIFIILADFADIHSDKNENILTSIASQILSTVENYMSFQIKIGISSNNNNINQIKSAYDQATITMKENSNKISVYNPDMLPQQNSNNDMKISELINIIVRRNTSQAKTYIENIFKDHIYENKSPQAIKKDAILLISNCFSELICVNTNMHAFDLLISDSENKIDACTTKEDIQQMFIKIVCELIDLNPTISEQCNYIIIQANKFISDNYNKEIRIADIANQLHVNSSYLSRIYKKYTGMSFITALNQYRVDCAKTLLKSKKYLVSEVGYMVGFDDPAYFTNVFTKYVGKSPKAYQDEI